MDKLLLETYSDFLIFNQGQASATTFSEATDKIISHDKFTRFLNHRDFGGKDLWKFVKPIVKKVRKGVLSIDDCINEKPYSRESDINCWHYSHMKSQCVKGVEIMTALYSGDELNVPLDYKTISKPAVYCDLETKKIKRKSNVSKNELARALIRDSLEKGLDISYITADSWFCCGETLNFVEQKNKKYVFAIKSNRKLFSTVQDREKNLGTRLSLAELDDDTPTPFFLNNVDHQVYVMKKTFTNGDGTRGVLFLVTNEADMSGEDLYLIYHKRWAIEVLHKSLKNNTSLSKSPASGRRAQQSHIFCSFYAYIKLERAREKSGKNHFRQKRDIHILMLKNCRKHYGESFHIAA